MTDHQRRETVFTVAAYVALFLAAAGFLVLCVVIATLNPSLSGGSPLPAGSVLTLKGTP